MPSKQAEQFPYLSLDELLDLLEGTAGQRMRRLLEDHRESHRHARGSSFNHQAWPGGFWDHTTEICNLAHVLYGTLGALRPLPFSLSDALLVLCAHDLEKLYRYDEHGNPDRRLDAKSDKAQFRLELLDRYGIELTDEQQNALRYAEGVRDTDYSPERRTMGELAAFVHTCDLLSARLWFEHPLAANDPWPGARRQLPAG